MKRPGLTTLVRFIKNDLQTAELEDEEYHLCLRGQIGQYLTEVQNRSLHGRINEPLVSGDNLIVDVPIIYAESQEICCVRSFLHG